MAKSGAAFGAALFRDFVLCGATECNVDNASKSFILMSLSSSVQLSAAQCSAVQGSAEGQKRDFQSAVGNSLMLVRTAAAHYE